MVLKKNSWGLKINKGDVRFENTLSKSMINTLDESDDFLFSENKTI